MVFKIRWIIDNLMRIKSYLFKILKLLKFRITIIKRRIEKYYYLSKRVSYDCHKNPKRLKVPNDFQPPPCSYYGYSGPWIENYFFVYWCKHEKEILADSKINRIYIPIFWTDYYSKHEPPSFKIQHYLDTCLSKDKKYFTVVQYASGIQENIRDNVLVFSAGGIGDIPIPLFKGLPKTKKKREERNILCSFMGHLSGSYDVSGVRSKMANVLKEKEGFYFGLGTLEKFIDITSRSVFCLCPRGFGRTSFRLYEAMALGAIPIYIWDDKEWLPYKEILDWDSFAISININDIGKLPNILHAHTAKMIEQKQHKIKELYKKYFTLEGTSRQIIRTLKEEQ